MYRFLTVVGLLAAAVLIAASATMNFAFVSSLGKTPFEGQVLGTVSIAIDVLKALLAVFIAKAVRDKEWTFVIVGGAAFFLFSAGSFVAASGFASVNRGAITETRKSSALLLGQVESDLETARKRSSALPQHRPIGVLEEALGALRIDPRWTASRGCTALVSSQQREHCGKISEIRIELAAALESQRLDNAIASLTTSANELRRKGASERPDPQAYFLAQIFGLDEGNVQRLLMSLLALLVEVSSALGIYLATGHGGNPARSTMSSKVLPQLGSVASQATISGDRNCETLPPAPPAGDDVETAAGKPERARRTGGARARIGIASAKSHDD